MEASKPNNIKRKTPTIDEATFENRFLSKPIVSSLVNYLKNVNIFYFKQSHLYLITEIFSCIDTREIRAEDRAIGFERFAALLSSVTFDGIIKVI